MAPSTVAKAASAASKASPGEDGKGALEFRFAPDYRSGYLDSGLGSGRSRSKTHRHPATPESTPARAMNRPMKTRKFKKADWELDFFFISGAWARARVIR